MTKKESMTKEKKKGIKRPSQQDDDVKQTKILKQKKRKNDSVTQTIHESNVIDDTEENTGDRGKVTEVKKKGPSKRQLKKEKAEIRALETKEANKQIIAKKVLNYISKWKHVKSEWKFEKLKQIWLMDNLLNDKYIPDEHFTTALEYFEGSKGSAKKQLINKAMEVIKKTEENAEENAEENDKVTESVEYKRARQLIQALPIET